MALPSFFVNNYNLAISVQVLQNLLNVNAANNDFLGVLQFCF